MFLASPIWLLLLIPWAALLIWLLQGRLQHYRVPFLQLWPRKTPQARPPQRALDKPPIALISLLLALLIVIVVSAQPMIHTGPPPSAQSADDVKIQRLAVRAGPTTQAMITLTNQGDLSHVKLIATADGNPLPPDEITLPHRTESQDYFLDIPRAAAQIQIAVQDEDGSAIGDPARATLRGAWPILEPASPLSPALQRMIQVYTRRRPPGEGSRRIEIIASSIQPPPAQPCALVLNGQDADASLSAAPVFTVYQSPLTRSVDWQRVLARAKISSPPRGDWQPLILVGNAAILAQSQQPVRRVWVGFDSDNFPRYPDFVVFWTSVFDWLGQGGPVYESQIPPTPAAPQASSNATASLSAPLLLAALGLICFSAMAWKVPRAASANSPQS
jgi:hypothetical protein